MTGTSASGIGSAVIGLVLMAAAGGVEAEIDNGEVERSLQLLEEYAATGSAMSQQSEIDADVYRQQMNQLDAALESEGASSEQLQTFRERAEQIGQENGILE